MEKPESRVASQEPLFRTRITEFYGIRLPVIASGLMWLANADYVGAAVNAGLMGFMTSASFPDPQDLRREIRRCREITLGKPFGVNIGVRAADTDEERISRVLDVVIEEGVGFVETYGHNPEALLPRLHDAGIKVLHKVPAVRFARKAQSVGVDAVTVLGAEAGGHPGMDLVGTMVQAGVAARDIRIPLIVAGGIGTGAHLVAALALGADGVAIGTRFLVAEEIWAHRSYKERLVKADETQTSLILQSLKKTQRAFANEKAKLVEKLEREHSGDIEVLFPHIAGLLGRKAYETGDYEQAVLSLGQAVVFADRIEPLAAIVARLEDEARAALARLDRLHVAREPGHARKTIAKKGQGGRE
jgi:NAD(P)H-dependent flavin oxidoreductase YrpB (nitropropane dioxygenase family)